jgi:hypothetical protein
MNTWKKFVKASVAFLALFLFSTNVLANEDDSFVNYDSIVNELKSSEASTVSAPVEEETDWNQIALHGDLGLGTSFISVTTPDGTAATGMLKGVHIGVGANLLSPKARAELAFTNYSPEHLNTGVKVDLRELEVRFVFLPMTSEKTMMRMGAGLASRYMNVNVNGVSNYRATTPVSVFLLGFERKLAKNVYLGPDLSYRSALISDTFDKSAWDVAIRINALF